MILIRSIILIIAFFLVSLIIFGDTAAQAQDTTANDITMLMEKAKDQVNLGHYEEAIGYYNKVLAIDPNDLDALNNKGTALHNLGKYNEAIEHYDKILSMDPDDVYALANKGLALHNRTI